MQHWLHPSSQDDKKSSRYNYYQSTYDYKGSFDFIQENIGRDNTSHILNRDISSNTITTVNNDASAYLNQALYNNEISPSSKSNYVNFNRNGHQRKKIIDIDTIMSLLLLIWFVILMTGILYKMIVDGPKEFFRFYTNWSWFLHTIFFTIDTAAYFEFRADKRLRYFLASWLFWFGYGTAWLVYFLVIPVFKDNAGILQQIADSSHLPLGTVLEGDRLFHTFPQIPYIIYFIIRRRYFFMVVRNWYKNYYEWFAYASFQVFSSLLMVGIYWSVSNTAEIYGLKTPIAEMIGIALGSTLIFVVLPLTGLYGTALASI